MPVAVHKTEGPSTALVFLGILIDTVKMEIRLPADKLARLQLLINQWSAKTVCTKRDLLLLLGYLQHACKVVPSGRSCLRRMINTSTYAKQLYGSLDRTFGGGLCFWQTGMALGLCPLDPSYARTSFSLRMRQAPGGVRYLHVAPRVVSIYMAPLVGGGGPHYSKGALIDRDGLCCVGVAVVCQVG